MSEERLIVEFGPYQLDTGTHTLSIGGELVELEPLPFEILITLIKSAPNLVTRTELFDRHWAQVEVTDNVLDQAITALRREFRRQPGGDRYVQTIKKRGFRFREPLRPQSIADISSKQLESPTEGEKDDRIENPSAQPRAEKQAPRRATACDEVSAAESGKPARTVQRETISLPADHVDTLRLINEYKVVTAEHLEKLTGGSKTTISERLFKLFELGYLDRRNLQGNAQGYSVPKAGMAVLVERGLTSKKELNRKDVRFKELDVSSIIERLAVSEIHVALEMSCREGSVRLKSWKAAEELQDHVVTWQSGQRERLPLKPHAFFTLEDSSRPVGHNRLHFFLDIDNPTTSHEQFQKNMLAYWHYLDGGKYTERHGLRFFRVVTCCSTNDRAEILTRLTVDAVPLAAHRHYLFGALIIAVKDILGNVFLRPLDMGSGTRHKLIPTIPTPASYPNLTER